MMYLNVLHHWEKSIIPKLVNDIRDIGLSDLDLLSKMFKNSEVIKCNLYLKSDTCKYLIDIIFF